MKKKSRGFTLIELSFVLLISMMAIAWGMWAKVNSVRQSNADVQGDALKTLSNSVGTYMTNNYNNLVNGTVIAGFANAYAPTIPELIAAGLLSNNFSTNNFYGGSYGIQVNKFPVGCVSPNCDLVSLSYLTNAIIDYRTGLIDGGTLGEAANRIGGDGGWSTRIAPATISGTVGGWSAANPVTAAGQPVAGILAVRGGYGSSGWAQFLRRDGTLPMTGALNMANNNINAANQVNSVTLNNTGTASIGGNLSVTGTSTTNGITNTGAVNTTTLATTGGASVGGNLNVAGASTTNGITNNGAVNTTTLATSSTATIGGNLTVTGSSITNGITNTGNISTTGDTSTGRLILNTTVNNGDACPGMNGYQARTTAGSIASCINSVWTTPNATATPTPCTTQTVGGWSATGGSNGTCYGTAGAAASGASVTVSASSGGSGSASYTCLGGVWGWTSGSCTPTPCPTQSVSWGSGCSGTISGAANGSTGTVTASTGTGSATFQCNVGTWSNTSGTCTPPVTCSGGQTVYWGSGCYGTIPGGTYSNWSSTGVSNSNGNRTGSGTAQCQGGTWSTSGSCGYLVVPVASFPQVQTTDGVWDYAYISDSDATWRVNACAAKGAGWTVSSYTVGQMFSGKACWNTPSQSSCAAYQWQPCPSCNVLGTLYCQAP